MRSQRSSGALVALDHTPKTPEDSGVWSEDSLSLRHHAAFFCLEPGVLVMGDTELNLPVSTLIEKISYFTPTLE